MTPAVQEEDGVRIKKKSLARASEWVKSEFRPKICPFSLGRRLSHAPTDDICRDRRGETGRLVVVRLGGGWWEENGGMDKWIIHQRCHSSASCSAHRPQRRRSSTHSFVKRGWQPQWKSVDALKVKMAKAAGRNICSGKIEHQKSNKRVSRRENFGGILSRESCRFIQLLLQQEVDKRAGVCVPTSFDCSHLVVKTIVDDVWLS